MQIDQSVCLITGAANGIGRALAIALAARGAHLALADLDGDGLQRLRADLAKHPSCQVSTHLVDVADRDAVHRLPAAVEAAHGGLDILINNAGVAIGGTFEQASEADFEWLLSINLIGLTRVTRACLPLLRRRPAARIVNISSLFGIIAPPELAAYATSKYAVRGFSDALRHEFAGSRIGVTCVHPGGVRTSIADNARMPRQFDPAEVARLRGAVNALLRLPPEAVAARIVEGIARDKPRIIIGTDAWLGVFLERFMPVRYYSVMSLLIGAARSRQS